MARDLKGKRLLVMGGTRISCEIIKYAKKMGCVVCVTDYNSVEDSPGKQIADEIYNVSTLDVDAMVDLVQREKIDGIIVGFNDLQLPYYAEICERTGLPSYATKEQLELFSNKNLYKPLLRQFNIPTVEEYEIDSEDDAVRSDRIKYPVLVKPADGSGARGITICHDALELTSAIVKARKASRTGKILVERYIEGREVTVNWLFVNGSYYLTSIANRHVKHNQEGVIPLPVGYSYPSWILPKYQAEIEGNCKKMFRAVGIKNGMMFMQCKVEDDVCIVYDIGFRLTGTQEYVNLEYACGYNPMEMMIHFSLAGDMGEPDIAKKIDPTFGGKYGFNVSCLAAPGKIGELSGNEEVLKYPEVAQTIIAHYAGETITESMKGLLAQICIRILGIVEKKEELYPAMKKIDDTIKIISTEGKNLKLAGIDPEDIEGYIL